MGDGHCIYRLLYYLSNARLHLTLRVIHYYFRTQDENGLHARVHRDGRLGTAKLVALFAGTVCLEKSEMIVAMPTSGLLRPPLTRAVPHFFGAPLSHCGDLCMPISGSLPSEGSGNTYADYFEPRKAEIPCITGPEPRSSEKGGGESGLFRYSQPVFLPRVGPVRVWSRHTLTGVH